MDPLNPQVRAPTAKPPHPMDKAWQDIVAEDHPKMCLGKSARSPEKFEDHLSEPARSSARSLENLEDNISEP